ncbi:unnamed protein product [Cuscuta epithymum]|nr:unnamed protein product [Cuscuta epithymum]
MIFQYFVTQKFVFRVYICTGFLEMLRICDGSR